MMTMTCDKISQGTAVTDKKINMISSFLSFEGTKWSIFGRHIQHAQICPRAIKDISRLLSVRRIRSAGDGTYDNLWTASKDAITRTVIITVSN